MIEKEPYWENLVEYYYDHVHWDETPTISIYEWLERDYKASTNLNAKYIHFDDPARLQWFIMRWTDDRKVYS